jgi:membrane-associated phospholipid phosphatase
MTRFRQLMTAIALSTYFMVVYGSCATITSLRSNVGSIVYEWERHIPLVPIFIIPYMSIDIFFFLAPFLCKTREGCSVLIRRIVAGITIAGLCYLIFPLKLAMERPLVEGWSKPIFNFLHGFDQPYNLLPSLHIILRTILTEHYVESSRGLWRISVHLWFFLIGASTLLIHQHHVIDVVAGFIVAVIICYRFPNQPRDRYVSHGRRLAYLYTLLAFTLAVLACLYLPVSAILWWPSISCGVVALSYGGYIGNLMYVPRG